MKSNKTNSGQENQTRQKHIASKVKFAKSLFYVASEYDKMRGTTNACQALHNAIGERDVYNICEDDLDVLIDSLNAVIADHKGYVFRENPIFDSSPAQTTCGGEPCRDELSYNKLYKGEFKI